MRKPWNVADGWEVLKDQFDNGIAYAVFADATISAADALNMLISVIVKTRVFQTQYAEWHAIPPGDRTLANAWIWWDMKARLKRKIGSVPGEMGSGQHYRGNAAGQIIQHQPADDTQYESLNEYFARGHSSTQQTISNQLNQIQQQAMVMQQFQQQLEMNAAQPWQQQHQQSTHL